MIALTPEQQQYVDAQIATGLFKRPTDVVHAALDLLRHRQNEYNQLTTALDQVERGECDQLDIEDIKKRGRERMANR